MDDDYQDLVERKSVRHATILALISALLLSVALVVLVVGVSRSRLPPVDRARTHPDARIRLPGSRRRHGIGDRWSGPAGDIDADRGSDRVGGRCSVPDPDPVVGAVGAAVASSLSYAFGFVLTVVVGSQKIGRPFLPLVIPTRSEIDDYVQFARLTFRRVSPEVGREPRRPQAGARARSASRVWRNTDTRVWTQRVERRTGPRGQPDSPATRPALRQGRTGTKPMRASLDCAR